MPEPTASVDELVERLALEEHPEGGWFRRTWQHESDIDGRPLASSIHYLLPDGVVSCWHRIDADEMWIFNDGAPLGLSVVSPGRSVETVGIGPPTVPGVVVQHIVPAGAWQSARSGGAFTLVTCVVVPAFVWEGFELAPEGWTPVDVTTP